MVESLITLLVIASLTVSLILLGISYKWPNAARVLLVLLFLWASYINTKTAISDPEDYLNYASFAWWRIYRDFINGTFAENITAIVLIIAFFQLMIAILLTGKGKLLKWGGIMAIVFLIAVAPLGTGSGFPSTLILALAVYFIIRRPLSSSLWEQLIKKMSAFKSHKPINS